VGPDEFTRTSRLTQPRGNVKVGGARIIRESCVSFSKRQLGLEKKTLVSERKSVGLPHLFWGGVEGEREKVHDVAHIQAMECRNGKQDKEGRLNSSEKKGTSGKENQRKCVCGCPPGKWGDQNEKGWSQGQLLEGKGERNRTGGGENALPDPGQRTISWPEGGETCVGGEQRRRKDSSVRGYPFNKVFLKEEREKKGSLRKRGTSQRRDSSDYNEREKPTTTLSEMDKHTTEEGKVS